MTPMLLGLTIIIAATAIVLSLGIALTKRFYIAAHPDQWLMRIHNGTLIDAGIGIACWRKPGDVVVTFTSTLQRVRFNVDALSHDRIPIHVEGFVLWSISPTGEAPFRAFRQLGLMDLSRQPFDMRERKHLLTTQQHRAFRNLLAAEVQRHLSTMRFGTLLTEQDGLLQGLVERLRPLEASFGVLFDQVEINVIRAQDSSIMDDLAIEEIEAVRTQADQVRLRAEESRQRRHLESAARLAQEQATLDREQLELSRQQRQRRQAIDAELSLEAEHAEARLAQASQERQNQALQARLHAIRAEAQARRDAALAMSEADEAISADVRAHQLQRQTIEQLTDALGALPLSDARWVTVGSESPISGLVGLLHGLRDAAAASTDPPAQI
ncbi:MAG: SPFH domain-containing protein [Myxococcota bacterium]